MLNDTVWIEVDPTKPIQDINRIYIHKAIPPSSFVSLRTVAARSREDNPPCEGASGTDPYAKAQAAAQASLEFRPTLSWPQRQQRVS